MSDTRQRLLDGTLETLRLHGIAGLSARSVAAAAGVNQALVFYHFGTVDQLVDAACRAGAEERVAAYRERFASVTSLRDLIEVAREVHRTESERGNVTVMAQVLAGARHDDRLAPAGRHALGLWVGEVEQVLRRLLDGGPLAEVVDVGALARGVAAGFIGVELYAGVDAGVADDALDALTQLAALVDVVEQLGAPARAVLRRRMRRR